MFLHTIKALYNHRMYKKWLALFKSYFISSLEFRTELIVWFLLAIIPTCILFVVWQSIFASRSEIGGYQLASIIQYYLLGVFINEVTASHFENRRVNQIREGKIDHYLTRPLSFMTEILVGDTARKCMFVCLTFPIYSVIWFIVSKIWPTGELYFSLTSLASFSLLVLFAFSVEFFLALLNVICGFWLEGAQGLEHFKWIIITLFSGWFMPVEFMPSWLRYMVEILPFKYMYAVPIGILQNKANLALGDFLYMGGFVALLWLIASLLWRQALRKYSSAGG